MDLTEIKRDADYHLWMNYYIKNTAQCLSDGFIETELNGRLLESKLVSYQKPIS